MPYMYICINLQYPIYQNVCILSSYCTHSFYKHNEKNRHRCGFICVSKRGHIMTKMKKYVHSELICTHILQSQ